MTWLGMLWQPADLDGMYFLLWLVAVILVVVGIFKLIQGEPLLGAILIIVGLLVGPGGYSIFR